MAIEQDLYGTSYQVPQNKEKKWGSVVTAILLKMMQTLDSMSFLVGTSAFLVMPSISQALAAGATLSQSSCRHRISGSGGAVTLSAVTAIADGVADGILLQLCGTNDTNTVTVLDGANTRLNGNWTGGLGDTILLEWDAADSNWWEVLRNN